MTTTQEIIEEIKRKVEECDYAQYVSTKAGVYESYDPSVVDDIDFLLAELARAQAECAALKAENQRWRFRSYPNNPELPG